MRTDQFHSFLKAAVRVAGVLCLAAAAAFGQQQINLTAGSTTTTLPDGTVVPMWGYSCGAVVSGSTAVCAALNTAAAGAWSPVVITVPTGQDLQVNLTNSLPIPPGGTGIPTSLVIMGQLGGGLGTPGAYTQSPDHTNAQPLTWPIAGDPPGARLTGVGTPPMQGPRVQSFGTEVANGTTASLCWGVCGGTGPALRPGTYLLESGTHPSIQAPMGLVGMVVVTTAPSSGSTAGTAYGSGTTAVTYNAEIPLLMSEIDPGQNNAVSTAVNTLGFSETAVWTRQGSGGPVTAIAITSGGSGYTLAPIVTISGAGSNATAVATLTGGVVTAITITNAGDGYSSAPGSTTVTIAPAMGDTTGTGATATATVTMGGCGGGAHTCYPPAANYTPLYYLINGLAFNKTSTTGAGASLFSTSPATGLTAGTGQVLVRLVNGGLRMHVPSIVGAQTGASAASGFSLIAEDGFPAPGVPSVPRVQSEVFMAAGKTFDVMINVPAGGGTGLPVFDRELSLSSNANGRDGGMLAYIGVNGAGLPTTGAFAPAAPLAVNDSYTLHTGQNLAVTDPAKGVIANDTNIYGVKVVGTVPTGLILNTDGTFTYTGTVGTSFTYCGNGATSGAACATVTLALCSASGTCEGASGISVVADAYTSNVATSLSIKMPGVLANDKDAAGYPLTVATVTTGGVTGTTSLAPCASPGASNCVSVNSDGSFTANVPGSGVYSFSYTAKNSQGTASTSAATVTLTFPAASGLAVTVLDGTDKTTKITDYRWIIEEDRTFPVSGRPECTTNPPAAGCPYSNGGIVPTFGTNFHTSWMPVVATGCTGPLSCEALQSVYDPASGSHINAVCDVGNGICRPDPTNNGLATLNPNQVHLDPTRRYYLSVLPGDAANPFIGAYLGAPTNCAQQVPGNNTPLSTTCGHGMGGAPVPNPCVPGATTTCTASFAPVTVLTQPTPFPPGKLSVFVFQDDFPLNGEHDGGGGVDVLSPVEPGLGGFQITLFDDAGGTGDATGQPTYDMFNQPLTNSLAGMIDPVTQQDACPLSAVAGISTNVSAGQPNSPAGITGMIVTCPKFEADGKTLSPLAGQAVVNNLYPGRYGVVATPAADRIALGEEWLQTNTLDGQKAHDSFIRIGEPGYFQEFGPAGYHVSIGFANPALINARRPFVCNGTDANITGTNCTNSITGQVTTERVSRTPDERLYSSGDYSSWGFTQCYVSFGDPDGEDFAFTKCNSDGTFTLSNLPDGDWRVTVFDQWNDMLVDGLSTPVRLNHAVNGGVTNLGQIATSQWQANIYTTTFFDANGNGVRDANEDGLALVSTNIRFRDGSFSNFNNTDLMGNAGFNEVFPLFSWYVVETDSTRYKNTGTHVVYDAGGPADGTPCGNSVTPPVAPCGNSSIGASLANTAEVVSVPTNLRVPGAVYCATADCTGKSIASGPGSSDPPSACTTSPSTGATTCTTTLSTGRIDPPWVVSEGWQGFSGQNSFIEFGKKPFAAGENGGIRGHVVYASTRPFDDPRMLLQLSWEPLVPNVTINLYQEGTAADGTQSLTLIDTTKTSSWDDWAQGFRSDGNPNMSCPGQWPAPTTTASGDLFFFSLFNQPMWLDIYANAGTPAHTIPNNSQFKCYDGMHNWNQVQPAPYDGMYQFPSVTGINPTTGKPTGTNCTICIPNPDTTDPYFGGLPMLPAGKYVVEVVVPPGYELVKEEDKNILIGDNYIAPPTVQFPGLAGSVFILPDQAAVGATYNANNAQNPTQDLGRPILPQGEGDTGSVEQFWPCVGASRIVPDFIGLFPQSNEVSPFAGSTRNLCDRKEVTLQDQSAALAKFYIFTSTHTASHFTGVITDDFTSEFDPFSPQFGEKFAPPNLPVSIRDWTGNEISRVYADHWGAYNGLTYSTWEVNPPNPTGYGPTMMVTCMNDPGTGTTPDPLYNPSYSQFCYEIPFMPGQTQYMDTPVVPTSAFAGAGYNNPDCNYPDQTPAIKEVDGDGVGPYISALGTSHPITVTALGDVSVNNYGYSGPSSATQPFNLKTVTRHYGFGTAKGTVMVDSYTVPAANITTWNDTTIVFTLPTNATVSSCLIQQQAQYKPSGTSNALCGQLTITRADNKLQSIDAVTITIGGKAPNHVAASASIQAAIDLASPGDMLMIDPTCTTIATGASATCSAAALHAAAPTQAAMQSAHQELLVMWKPIRLQGVGGASSVINGNTHPAGKLDVWRRQVNCLFGLAINGQPISGSNAFDPSGSYNCSATGTPNGNTWNFFHPYGAAGNFNPQIDRLPLEATVGWDANLNGNLAELLQEPSLMGALEGAAITVLSKGVNFPSDPYDSTLLAGFPAGTTLLVGNPNTSGNFAFGDSNSRCHTSGSNTTNPFPSNFQCNPSSIDGLGIQNSSQGGGGIFVHGWGHNIQIANNRVMNNEGTLSGGINVGQGEFPPAYLGGAAAINAAPGSCATSGTTNLQLPYCHDLHVNVHNNYIALNSSTGDELFSATPAGAGGISFCTGSDFYQFNYNWVCGNLSTGDGGGLGHLGFTYAGDIEHNSFLFNQSTNPTIATNGGAILVMGTPDVDPTCGATTDQDCVPALGTVGASDGAGPRTVVNANLIMGNAAESGSGGGIRLQNINGTDVVNFPNANSTVTFPGVGTTSPWYSVNITNNIIANNVAGWDGAGISLQDALNANIINNTVISNDTTASSGVLFSTLGAPLASSFGSNCIQAGGTTASCPQPAGVVSVQTSAVLGANLPASITCPTGHGVGGTGTGGLTNASCRRYSDPLLYNDLIWKNRSLYIGVGGLGTGAINQQNVVALYNAFGPQTLANQAASQPSADGTTPNTNGGATITGGTGACVAGSQYWDLGVRGDTGPTNHGGGTLRPNHSVITDATDYPGASNIGGDPGVIQQYCNGSRVPPENGGLGYNVPPGIADATVPNPVFNLTPVATVDEGNNWINIDWGPLALTNPSVTGPTDGNFGGGPALGNYGLASTSSSAYNAGINTLSGVAAPPTDIFGTTRPQAGVFDIGAVEIPAVTVLSATVAPSPLAFGNVAVGASSTMTLTVTNTGTGALAGGTFTFGGGTPQPFSRPGGGAGGTCGATLAIGATCTVNVVFTPAAITSYSRTLAVAYTAATVTGTPVTLTGAGVAAVRTATVSPTTLAFGNQAVGTASGSRTVTVTNTGNIALAGGTFTFGGGTPQPFSRPLLGGGTCGATLAIGASCTINVVFTPLTATAFSRTLAVAYTTATVTGSPVTLTGTGITPGTLAFTAATNGTLTGAGLLRTLTFTTPTGTSETSVVTVTNTGAGGLTITGETLPINPGGRLTVTATDCNTTLAPGGTCSISLTVTGTAVDLGTLLAANNGSGTVGGNTALLIVVP